MLAISFERVTPLSFAAFDIRDFVSAAMAAVTLTVGYSEYRFLPAPGLAPPLEDFRGF